ncbi:MAG TPA: ATP-dependent DNA helicase RecQ [Thermoguttaceae bacterium]|nr:ATP-dependent DNA helicase RecQ [Thermoguttaceae bacterium]
MTTVNAPVCDDILVTWGLTDFRPLQREAIEAALTRRDSLVVMPTGSGKSLCYQAPALYADGVTVVISPLISLMKDQVDTLKARGLGAAFLNSTQHPREQEEIARATLAGDVVLLYVSPERCMSPPFLSLLTRLYGEHRLAAIVVDEAHCISQWGQDFRLDYGELGNLRTLFPGVAIHAYTATARPRVRDEIVAALQLRDPCVLVGDFDRPNLTLIVDDRVDLDFQLRHLLRDLDGPAIVYTITRAEAERIAADLWQGGFISAAAYHAGMPDDARKRVQDKFMAGGVDVIVATVAFGMGIDKPDVRYVIHAAMPSSLEMYHQQIGRAGRDGLPASCVMFYDDDDFDTWCRIMKIDRRECLKNLRHGVGAHSLEEHSYLHLTAMYEYCWHSDCRRAFLLKYFGQDYPADNCAACDACGSGYLSCTTADPSRDREGAAD